MSTTDRTPFETFWIAKGAAPGSLQDIERFAREEKLRLRDDFGFPRAGFLPADAPIGAKTVFNQKRDLKRLAEIANSEGSAIPTGSWPDHVGVRENLNENVDALLEVGGALPTGEERFTGARSLTDEEVEDIAARRAREFIVERCEELDDAGVDGADTLEAVVRDDPLPDVPDVDLAALEDDLADIADEFGLDLVTDAIAECRDRLTGPEDGLEAGTTEILEELQDRFGVQITSPETALDQLERRVNISEREAEQAAANRLSRAFGQQFNTLDEAIDRLRERIAQARGERLRVADVRVRRAAGETRVFIDSDLEDFDDWRDNAERRVRRELDLSAIEPPQTVTVGEVVVRGGQLEEIDLEQGRARLGAIEEPQPLEAERARREQERLPEAETDVDELADRAIDLLEGP